jgi:Holliday junction resolvase RusA-like endonuclease
MFLQITLDGPPRGKGRPRSRIVPAKGTRPAFVNAYTDSATRAYEGRLSAQAGRAMGRSEMLDEALAVVVDAHMPIPESWSKKKKAAALAGDLMPCGKPDADNIGKVVDALNEVVWRDDSAIVRLKVLKVYSDNPRLVISVWTWAQWVADGGS